jgi:hypothetical protein
MHSDSVSARTWRGGRRAAAFLRARPEAGVGKPLRHRHRDPSACAPPRRAGRAMLLSRCACSCLGTATLLRPGAVP